MPDFSFEDAAWADGLSIIAGVDEAGRGPWAGPVVAGAAILDPATLPVDLAGRLDDSKKLSEAKRDELFEQIMIHCEAAIGIASVAEIDEINILQATFLAMTRAVSALSRVPDLALVDCNRPPKLSCPVKCVVRGDSKSLSIAAASIVAKVSRDRMMAKLADQHPGYGWERNKGYGTKEHKSALESLGVTDHHRKSYAPIIKILSPGAI